MEKTTTYQLDGSFVSVPPVWNGAPPVSKEQQTDCIFDKRDFADVVTIESLTPALVAAGGKRDELTKCVIQTAIDNLQTYASSGIMPNHNYDNFAIPVSEDEQEVDVVLSEDAKCVIDKMVNNAQMVLLDTLGHSTFVNSDVINVDLDKTRAVIHIVETHRANTTT